MLFAWAVESELLPGEVLYRLPAVKGLRRGRSDARESNPVRPVVAPHIDAVLPYLSDQIGAMIRLELLCGARGGELNAMRVRDIDTTGTVSEGFGKASKEQKAAKVFMQLFSSSATRP